MDRVTQSSASTKRGRRTSRKAGAAPSKSGELFAASIGSHVAPAHYRDRPLLAAFVTEDACWQFAVEEWSARKPSWWSFGARKTWREEGACLDAKKARLREQAVELGLRIVEPGPGRRGR